MHSPVGCTLALRTAAIGALARLPSLAALAWGAADDFELAALGGLSQVRELRVYLSDMGECTSVGVMQLAHARQLSSL